MTSSSLADVVRSCDDVCTKLFAPTLVRLSLQDEAIDPGVPGLEAKSLIQAIRCLPRRTRREVNGSSTRRLRKAQCLLGQSAPNAMSPRGLVHDHVLDASTQTGRQGEHDQRQHPDYFAFDPRHQHRVCIAGEQALHCLAIQRAGCARKLRQQARECLNRLVVRFTDNHNLNAHDLDPTEQLPSRGGTPETDPHVVRENHFKQVNDVHGHAAGDVLLTAVATRLAHGAGPGGVVGRLGGDEFAAVVIDRDGTAADRLDTLARVLARPVDSEPNVHTTVSLGWVRAVDHPGEDLSALLRRADEAMYAAKRSGRSGSRRARLGRLLGSVAGRRSGRRGAA